MTPPGEFPGAMFEEDKTRPMAPTGGAFDVLFEDATTGITGLDGMNTEYARTCGIPLSQVCAAIDNSRTNPTPPFKGSDDMPLHCCTSGVRRIRQE